VLLSEDGRYASGLERSGDAVALQLKPCATMLSQSDTVDALFAADCRASGSLARNPDAVVEVVENHL
jgi:hypothetical protein